MTREFNLIVDIGNSTSAFALFEKEKYIGHVTISTYEEKRKNIKLQIRKFLETLSEINYVINKGMIFSVVPGFNDEAKGIAKKYFKVKPTIFDWENYSFYKKDPRITDKIGADLLADLIGAEAIYGHPVIIADLGTVSKILVTDEHGTFTGASFIPGMEKQLRFMSNSTALLPDVSEAGGMAPEFGLNTIESMKHGVYWSTIGYIEKAKETQLKFLKHPVTLVLTGGNAVFVKDNIEDKVFDPILTLKGMNILFMEANK